MASRPPGHGTTPAPTPRFETGGRAQAVLVTLLLVESAFMLVLAGVLVVDLATRQRQTEVAFPLAEVGLCLFVVVGLVLMARGLRRESRWARSPAITLQLIGLPFAGRLIQFGGIRIALGVPLGLVLLAALVLLFATASGAAYERSDPSSEQPAGPDAR